MPLIQTSPLSFPTRGQTSGNPVGIPSGILGELVNSNVLARYSTLAKAGKLFSAYAVVTVPVIFSTAAGTGGPLIWNKPSSNIDAHILAIGVGVTTAAATTAGAIGLTGNVGQSIAPTSTTAIDASGALYIGGAATQMGGVYRIGTPTNAGNIFVPVFQYGVTATTAMFTTTWIDVGGAMVVPPGGWGAIAASATPTALVMNVAIVWAELPV